MNGLFEWLARLAHEVKRWAVVNPWEIGVLVRLGNRPRLLAPGWHWRIPVIDSVRLVNSRLRIGVFPSQTISTTDGKTITVAGIVGFHIEDPLVAMLALQQPEISVAAFVQASIASYISVRAFEEIAVSDMETAAKAELEEAARGIKFEFVRVTDYAAVRTLRLLMERWRPATSVDVHDKEREAEATS